MKHKTSVVTTLFALVTLLATGFYQTAVAQRRGHSTTDTVPVSDMTVTVSSLELLGTNTVIVSWSVKKSGTVTIKPYEVRLELSRNGVTERFVQTATANASFVKFDLSGISADRRAKLFGPGLKASTIVKATFYRHQGSTKFLSIQEAYKTVTLNVADFSSAAK